MSSTVLGWLSFRKDKKMVEGHNDELQDFPSLRVLEAVKRKSPLLWDLIYTTFVSLPECTPRGRNACPAPGGDAASQADVRDMRFHVLPRNVQRLVGVQNLYSPSFFALVSNQSLWISMKNGRKYSTPSLFSL